MTQILKTGFDWCVQERLRITNGTWPTTSLNPIDSYHMEEITYLDFMERIKKVETVNSMPRKHEHYLEYRMYGLVPYNISPIQKGIQFGHAVVRYGQQVKQFEKLSTIYDIYAKKWETFIILDGGTTNENPNRLGSIQKYTQELKNNGVFLAEFREPDLNDTLTAIAFLVDERVFNRELYPDFIINENANFITNEKQHKNWIEKIGGEQNLFLRDFLHPSRFKLA